VRTARAPEEDVRERRALPLVGGGVDVEDDRPR
jgi:hypothetical protein